MFWKDPLSILLFALTMQATRFSVCYVLGPVHFQQRREVALAFRELPSLWEANIAAVPASPEVRE